MKLKKLTRRGVWTDKKVNKKIRSGHGQGEFATYQPWIGVRDLSSKGVSTRMFSPKTGRMMQFLSNIERDTFLMAEFREDFVDYWEQWPLERALTQRGADQLKYRHPIYFGTRIPTVMTVDGVLTLRQEGRLTRRAIDCKSSSAISHARTREKLAIVDSACSQMGLTHLVVTELSTRRQEVKNVLWVRMATVKSGEIVPVPGAFDMWPMRMHRHLRRHRAEPSFSSMPLNKYCQWFDAQHGLPRGLSLRCMKLLMWQHLVEFHLGATAPERLPLGSLTVNPAKAIRTNFETQPS